MRNYLLYILGCIGLLAACSKDKGNYDYVDVPDPLVTNLDTAYVAISGDSLIIAPKVELRSGKNDYSCEWTIIIPGTMGEELHYTTPELRIVFGLGANRYPGLLRVLDKNTGQKYIFKFVVKGQTQFTRGTLVLSNAGNQSALSFIKPDGTLQPDLYTAINKVSLPAGAMQLVPIQNQFYMNQLNNYWISYSSNGSGAVQIDANNLQRTKDIQDYFFDKPAGLRVDKLMNMINGVTTGVFNGKLYLGATETAPFWPYYGFWGVPIAGNYNVAPNVIHNMFDRPYDGYFLGFDKDKKKLVRFTTGAFLDTAYNVEDSAFNPKNLKMDLLFMDRFSDNAQYAYFDSAGKKIELRFSAEFSNDGRRFRALGKREFPGAALLQPDSRWVTSPVVVFFFSSNDKIYRYNPLNDEIKALDASFGGKKVTMLKLLNSGNLLIAGVEGSLYYLDVSTGNNGIITKQVNGIPGTPADILVRDN